MSSLSMVESNLPPGFRFHPKDEELVCDYLMKKVTCSNQPSLMIEVDLNKSEPWDIPVIACVGGKEWYFYSQRDKKYATGLRTNRATISGYWKATGKDRAVFSKGTLVGMRKTLVFYQGRAPKGKKTDWVIHEFRLAGPPGAPKISSIKEEDWVLCRMFNKNKEMHAKQETKNLCYGETISSTLSPLMEPYIIFNHDYEQMPHVSIFNPDQTTPTTNISQNTHNSMSSSCDNEALEAILDHIVMNEYSHSYGEGSSESFLSEVGGLVDAMWSHY